MSHRVNNYQFKELYKEGQGLVTDLEYQFNQARLDKLLAQHYTAALNTEKGN
jgi:hypothetical protein